MPCISPIHINDKDGRREVPCGRCVYCMKRKRLEWTTRLLIESTNSVIPPVMVTLTYDDEHIPIDENGDTVVNKKDIQDFFKRLRYYVPENFKYFIASEYGPRNLRPHYHAILFNFPQKYVTEEFIEKVWTKGFCTCGIATDGGISYCAKYVSFRSQDFGKRPNFMLASRRPAIGKCYLDRLNLLKWHNSNLFDNNYIQINSNKFPVPRYLKEKIYSKLDRKLMNEHYELYVKPYLMEEIYDRIERKLNGDNVTTIDDQIELDNRKYYKSLKKQKDI